MFYITLKTGEIICENIPSKILAYRIGRSLGECLVLQGPGIVFEFSNEEREKENLIYLLDGGFSFDIKQLSICTIKRRNGDKYQVDFENRKKPFSQLYNNANMAVNKFFEIKKEFKL